MNEGMKEMFYLMMHSTHFYLQLYGIGCMVKDHSESERGILLPPHWLLFPITSKVFFKEGWKEMFYVTTHSNTFYLWLYGVGHMIKDHSDSERGILLLPHGLLFPFSSKGSFICTILGLCYTSHGELAGMRNSSVGSPWANAITMQLHLVPAILEA